MTDPVTQKSRFLRIYMSALHPDTLVAYAKWFGKAEETMTTAEISAIDCNGMTLTCTMETGEKKVVLVPIEPPLKSYDDVRPRLVVMKEAAEEALGMIKVPQLTTFSVPAGAYITGFNAVLILYICFYGASSASWMPYYQSLAGPAKSVVSYTGAMPWTFALWFFGAGHAAEALYTAILCKKHCIGFLVCAMYVFSTLMAGYPVWMGMRKRIQSSRIDSVNVKI